jgi:integrase/recombinase XerD
MNNILTQLKADQLEVVNTVMSDLALEGVHTIRELQLKLETELQWQLHPPQTSLAIKKLISELDTPSDEQPPSSFNTREVIDKFLASKKSIGRSEETLRTYLNTLRPFARAYPELPSTPEPIEKYIAEHRGTGSTAKNIYRFLGTFYNWASDRLDVVNPMAKVEKPTSKAKPPQHLTVTQAKALLSAIRTALELALVTCFFGLGLRLSEALRLKVIDIGENTIMVHGKERDELAILPAQFRDALVNLTKGKSEQEYVFTGRQGPLSDSRIQGIIKELFKRANITGVRSSPHTLRHSKGVLSTMFGLDPFSNRRLLRHTSTQMTDRYNELNLEELRQKDSMYNPMLRLLNKPELGKKPDYPQRQPGVDIASLAEEPDADAEQYPGQYAQVKTGDGQQVGGAGAGEIVFYWLGDVISDAQDDALRQRCLRLRYSPGDAPGQAVS